MTRSERHIERQRPSFKKRLFIFLFICISTFAVLSFYLKSIIKIEAPQKDLGQKVIIQLPSGNHIYTYENLIVKENGRLYYKGERNTLDLTGGIILYEEWDD
ncbi:hypothetical protein [Cytobacillus dafuensis]|uniref:Uncharacterized protein n=1 Tax=Cytobacillus dafuensis TaxID=1742359 RepID=A0A5B8Z4U4_CYTDA|nr:hypothetical protein [Cytobacillus dafuensis]QED47293.1 hypothetical protein FSZ17_08575 [Cytobacillus dafuensis]